ncbi:MAG: VWA domain-containing protein [Gammaproteobacteria bacterium]|nr:VWA domain-containing protein [Gammaproteobacteria bacterium]
MRKLGLLILVAMLSLPVHASDQRDVVLVLDNSGSMRANDPARLSVSAVTDFIRAQAGGTRVAIVIFDGSPRLVQPLTEVTFDNKDVLLSSLDRLNFSGQWTDTASAIERGLYELRLNGRMEADKAIILMTDGIIDTGVPARDVEKAQWLREDLAEDAADEGIRVFAVAFTENADFQLLQSVAQATDAEYFRAIRAEDIAPVLRRIDRVLDTPRRLAQQSSDRGDFLSRSPSTDSGSEDFTTPTEPAGGDEPERIVYREPATVQADSDTADGSAEPGDQAEEEETSSLRVILMILALLVLGAVGVSIFWGDAVMGFLKRTTSRKETEDHGPSAVLYDVYDPSDIKRYELGLKPAVIGRVSGSDPSMDYIVVDERTVGRWHATIERRGQSFWIRDEGSVNGTFVNDQRVTTEHPLKHGDLVRVHRHEFEFVIPELFDSDRTMISPEAKMKKPEESDAD